MKERCVLIGGAGFLGFNTARGLLEAGYDVVIVDKNQPKPELFSKSGNIAQILLADYRNLKKISSILSNGDILFHFAYSTLPGTPFSKMETDVEENVFESIKLFRAAVEKGVKKIIFPSSGGTVYGEGKSFPINEDAATTPICSYGITKLMVEKYLYFLHRIYGIDYLIFRISNSYGPGQRAYTDQGLISNAMAKMLNGSEINVFGDGQIVRDYIYIDDVVRAFLIGLEQDLRNKIYNIGTGIGYSINEVIESISKIINVKPKISYSKKRLIDVGKNILDSERMRGESGWRARVTVEEGIRKTYAWIKNAI